MKNLFVIALILSIGLQLSAQKINLNQGDKFSYRSSTFTKENFTQSDTQKEKLSEHFDANQMNFCVTEILPECYKIIGKFNYFNVYNRSKNDGDEQWKSGPFFDHSLMNENTSLIVPGYSIEFILSEKGEVSNMRILNQEKQKADRSSVNDSIFLAANEKGLLVYFKAFPETIAKGQQFEISQKNYTVTGIEDKIVTLASIVDENERVEKDQLKYDLNTGLMLEFNQFQQIDNQEKSEKNYVGSGEYEEIKGLNDLFQLGRSQLVMNNKEPFTCKYKDNDVIVDTTFAEANTILRGRVMNSYPEKEIHLNWKETKPNAYHRYRLSVPLNEDGSYEFRLYLDKLTQVSIEYYEFGSFYLTPGDDLYLEVDNKQFDESLKATGIGSHNLNYCFNEFLHEEKEKNSLGSVYNKAKKKYLTSSPDEFKSYFLDFLAEKQNYLNDNCVWLAPDQYLAEFYESQTRIADLLGDYPKKQKYYREKENLEPYQIDESKFYDFYNLIHPDNDLMAFCADYDRLIRKYVFFFLDKKMEGITGVGNVINVSNYFDQLYPMRYGFSYSLFKGVSQHVLKYETVADALKRASWDTFEALYNQFIKEYPNSYKSKVLTEAYEKAKTVAPGQAAFNFELSDIEGNKGKLSDFKGKVVYIEFWSKSYTSLDSSFKHNRKKMQKAFKDKDIVFLYVTLDDNLKDIKKFMEEQGIGGVQLIANRKEEILLRDKYFFNGIPHYYIIDREGKIVQREAPSPREISDSPAILLDVLNKPIESNNERTIYLLKLMASILGFILFIVFGILLYNKRANKRKLKLSALNTKVRDLELTAIKAQMNPHFMYNCLNSIQHLVQQKQSNEAHAYISKFADLIRNVLKYSDRDEISLAEEIDMTKNYVTLEQLRFDIDFEVKVADGLDLYSIFIPPLLLQPLIENAILHGLTPKKGNKKLVLEIDSAPDFVCIRIEDNGVGRKKANEGKKDKTGRGLGFSKERLELLKEKHQTDYKMEITDLENNDGEATGTRIEICLSED